MIYEFEKPSIWIAIHATIIKNCFGIFACIALLGYLYGLAGFVRNILNHRFFIFFSRLTFGVFLNHILVLRFMQGSKHVMEYVNELSILTTLIVTEVIAFGLAVVTCITIEYPFLNLFNAILNKNGANIKSDK